MVMRSKNIFGPYEDKIVMAQGKTDINGPHQGAWIDTKTGENWFMSFQDLGAYGRVLHLNPMKWVNDWPEIGVDAENDGCGDPVRTYKKPNVGKAYPKMTPPESDEFNGSELGLQWQWHANYQTCWGFPSGNLGFFRLNCIPRPTDAVNLWGVSNLLLQKFPAPEFIATAKLTFDARFDGEEVGLVVMGMDYARIAVKREKGKLQVQTANCQQADKAGKEEVSIPNAIDTPTIYLRVHVWKGAECSFSYSLNDRSYIQTDDKFRVREGKWIGAKVGFYALREGVINDAGSADIDWFRVEK
jgi:beta-xylosidase